ncbi:DoxX-like family protein [Rubritalea profundi]|uniref:DoxX-like family protein n=1 Tax=Rubritalea profundi TaxID=1658618 RepID=UPI0026CC5DA0
MVVWFVNGLVCKVLGAVPRHEAIVARILDHDYAHHLMIMIGLSEMVMAAWVWSGKWKKLNVWTQITLVAVMNTLESLIAQDLLLWSRWNLVWAGVFISIVYFNHRVSKRI